MSAPERRSFDNGLWLCSNCATEIDRDPERFPVEVLKRWKSEAESAATRELGTRLPDKNDAINLLTAALTGKSKSIITGAVENVHQASTSALESMDPRFSVRSSYSDGVTQFILDAKEDVPAFMHIQKRSAKEFADKFERLIEHGEELEIGSSDISFSGSPLLQRILEGHVGTLSIVPPKRQAVHVNAD